VSGDASPLEAAARKAVAAPFGAILTLAPDDGQPVYIDGRKSNVAVSLGAPKGAKADCEWRGPHDILQRALSSDRALEAAFASGGLTIAGDMSVMARLQLTGTK